jgi:peptidoglycan-N-acetylglucosamine deacetylase
MVMTTSWDDGHPLDQRVAELLGKYNLSGTFYIPLENSRMVMTSSAIRDLAGRFEIGAHTVHHVDLTKVPSAIAETEIFQSKSRLEDLTGRSCEAFCFPKGHFRADHVRMVQRAGFRCARTVELLSIDFPRLVTGVHLMPTTVQARSHSFLAYGRNFVKRSGFRNLARFALHARTTNWVDISRRLLRLVAAQGGVFHLWGHSWEIDENQQWRQLEEVLDEMSKARRSQGCVSNSEVSASNWILT